MAHSQGSIRDHARERHQPHVEGSLGNRRAFGELTHSGDTFPARILSSTGDALADSHLTVDGRGGIDFTVAQCPLSAGTQPDARTRKFTVGRGSESVSVISIGTLFDLSG